MTYGGPDFSGAAEPGAVYADENDHQKQLQSQEWSFITPTAKKAEAETQTEDGDEEEEPSSARQSANAPPEFAEIFASLPVPPKQTSTLLPMKKYPIPHPLMKWFRGVPMNEWNDYEKPAMNLPTDAQQFVAIHAERVGLMHVDDVRSLANEFGWLHVNQLPQQLLRHWKPAEGPDIPINPGTWHRIDEPMPTSAEKEVSPPDLSGVSPAQLAALKEAVRREEIRQKTIAHADVEAQERAAAEATAKRVVVAVEELESEQSNESDVLREARLETSSISTSPFRGVPVEEKTSPESHAETQSHEVARERIKSLFMSSSARSDDQSTPVADGDYTAYAKRRMAELKRSSGQLGGEQR